MDIYTFFEHALRTEVLVVGDPWLVDAQKEEIRATAAELLRAEPFEHDSSQI